MEKSITALIVCFLIVLPVAAQQSENQLDIIVNRDSWSGFYIQANEGATILIDINVTASGDVFLLIVDEGEFEDYRINGTSFQTFESHHFMENLTLTFVVPHSDTWYFLFWNIGEYTTGYVVHGSVIPSPDGYVGNSSGFSPIVFIAIIVTITVIFPVGVVAYLIIKKPKPNSKIDDQTQFSIQD